MFRVSCFSQAAVDLNRCCSYHSIDQERGISDQFLALPDDIFSFQNRPKYIAVHKFGDREIATALFNNRR
jgi:hypothetical protein